MAACSDVPQAAPIDALWEKNPRKKGNVGTAATHLIFGGATVDRGRRRDRSDER